MQKLDFKPEKSKFSFRKNYQLHDLAEEQRKNLLTQWGFDFVQFGQDRRYEKVWEKGKDKPDAIIKYKDKSALLDWKAKHKSEWIINSRAVNSYLDWNKKLNIPVIITFFVFDNNNFIVDKRFAVLPFHNFEFCAKKQWDKNETMYFNKELPVFNKQNLIKYLFL